MLHHQLPAIHAGLRCIASTMDQCKPLDVLRNFLLRENEKPGKSMVASITPQQYILRDAVYQLENPMTR